jgi:hypothetical protein
MDVASLGSVRRDGRVRMALPMITATAPVELAWTRADLAVELAKRGMNKGAEIGVERGEYSEVLCKANPRLDLVCVDAWQAYKGYRDHVGQDKLDGFYQSTIKRLAPYRCMFLRAFSVDAAAMIQDGSLDFVYIDSNHSFDSVTADLNAWVPKVRRFGIVAGHDFGRSSVGQVKQAVEHWTSEHGIAPWYVLKGDRSPSWMWVNA